MKLASFLRWLVPSVAALGLVLTVNLAPSRADDAPAAPAAPAAGTAKITGTVNANNAPVAGAVVRLVKASDVPAKGGNKAGKGQAANPVKNAAGGNGGKGGGAGANIPSVAETTTAADGSFSFDKVADGDYVVMVNAKGQGRGKANVSVVNGANPAAVAVTLTANKAGGGKAGKNAPAAGN